jgi:beta-glucosidase/6-phospho-beta-glucosidase/beta-galactosidase
MIRENVLKFPAGFLWGTATSPTQVEGHAENEWTNFTAQDGGNCRIACDHYHRYPEDVEWMVKLGVNAYRLGIEWSRLQSAPFASLNQNELARYVDILDRLKAADITPMVVLHHFSNPPWINAGGGWTNAAAIPAFVDYVRKLVAALKDRVQLWNTFNEPVRHVLQSTDRVTAIRGGAGTGKTTMMREAVAAIESNGAKVFTFAPSAEASRGVLRTDAGFANAETVEALLQNEKLQAQVRGQVIWIDEAGL